MYLRIKLRFMPPISDGWVLTDARNQAEYIYFNKNKKKKKNSAFYSPLARSQVSFNATTTLAGTTKATMLLKMPVRYFPIN